MLHLKNASQAKECNFDEKSVCNEKTAVIYHDKYKTT